MGSGGYRNGGFGGGSFGGGGLGGGGGFGGGSSGGGGAGGPIVAADITDSTPAGRAMLTSDIVILDGGNP